MRPTSAGQGGYMVDRSALYRTAQNMGLTVRGPLEHLGQRGTAQELARSNSLLAAMQGTREADASAALRNLSADVGQLIAGRAEQEASRERAKAESIEAASMLSGLRAIVRPEDAELARSAILPRKQDALAILSGVAAEKDILAQTAVARAMNNLMPEEVFLKRRSFAGFTAAIGRVAPEEDFFKPHSLADIAAATKSVTFADTSLEQSLIAAATKRTAAESFAFSPVYSTGIADFLSRDATLAHLQATGVARAATEAMKASVATQAYDFFTKYKEAFAWQPRYEPWEWRDVPRPSPFWKDEPERDTPPMTPQGESLDDFEVNTAESGIAVAHRRMGRPDGTEDVPKSLFDMAVRTFIERKRKLPKQYELVEWILHEFQVDLSDRTMQRYGIKYYNGWRGLRAHFAHLLSL